MLPILKTYPRNTNVVGSARHPSILIAASMPTTCGVFVFQSQNGNEGYIYINGINPSTVMWGGLNEVMNNPAGGVAITGNLITHPAAPKQFRIPPGWILYGGPRVSSSIFLRGAYTTTGTPKWLPPAVAIGIGPANKDTLQSDRQYLFMLEQAAALNLYSGVEADYLNPPGSATQLATIPASGGMSSTTFPTILNWSTLRRDGRSTLSDNYRGFNGPLIVQSTGNAAAIGLMTGDWSGATAIYFNWVARSIQTVDIMTWYNSAT